jgi:hypothetical protein
MEEGSQDGEQLPCSPRRSGIDLSAGSPVGRDPRGVVPVAKRGGTTQARHISGFSGSHQRIGKRRSPCEGMATPIGGVGADPRLLRKISVT